MSADEREFRARAAQAIAAQAERDSVLLRRHRSANPAVARNEMIAAVAGRGDLEALVLVDERLAIAGEGLAERLRSLLADAPDVAVIGVAAGPGPRTVGAIGSDLVALSAWACAELRFDPRLAASPDAGAVDICLAARARGKRVLADPLAAIPGSGPQAPPVRHRLRADAFLRRKWSLPPGPALAPRRHPKV